MSADPIVVIAAALHREAYRGACGDFADASQGDREYFTSRATWLVQTLGILTAQDELRALRRDARNVVASWKRGDRLHFDLLHLQETLRPETLSLECERIRPHAAECSRAPIEWTAPAWGIRCTCGADPKRMEGSGS